MKALCHECGRVRNVKPVIRKVDGTFLYTCGVCWHVWGYHTHGMGIVGTLQWLNDVTKHVLSRHQVSITGRTSRSPGRGEMATLDELEAESCKTVADDPCDPCVVDMRLKSCLTCEWGGQVETSHTWKEKSDSMPEPMRLCYHFVEMVPARASFYCSLWEKKRS